MHTDVVQCLNCCRGILCTRIREKTVPFGLTFPRAMHVPKERYVHDFPVGKEERKDVFLLHAFRKRTDKERGARPPCEGVIDEVGRRGRSC
jgi:hypothetical protein